MTAMNSDLRALVEQGTRFLTMIIPAPSRSDHAAHRFEVERTNAIKQVSGEWRRDELEAHLAELPHDAGEAVIVIQSDGGSIFTEFIQNGVERAMVVEGSRPRLAPLIEARQRTIAHVVVEVDLAGADIHAFDGGTVIATDVVEGETEFIHRGHPGGWSQRRYQQRAENTWEVNADDAADAAVKLTRQTHARLILVAGPTRAKSMVADAITERIDVPVVRLEAGEAGAIAAEITRMTADVAATDSKELIEQVREGVGTGRSSTSRKQLLEALEQGRVETLLVHDDENDDFAGGSRAIDEAIEWALLTDARIHVVPTVAVLDEGLAGVLRW